MTALHECLYQFISDEQNLILQKDTEYTSAQQIQREIENTLLEGLSEEHRQLFHKYMDEENHLVSLQLRHIFCETLRMAHGLFNFPPQQP